MNLDPTFIKQEITGLRLAYPDLDAEEWELSLESETDLIEFLRSVERHRQDADTLAAAIDTQIDDLKARRNRYRLREDAMRRLAFNVMQHAGLKKAELPEATLSVRAGTPKVVITDESALTEDFIRTKREPAKDLIATMLKNGHAVPGAILSNAEPTLSVRIR